MRTKTFIVAVVAVLMTVGTVQADITIDTVRVGDVSNAADTAAHSGNSAGQGSVGYAYNIGTYEVTAGQYTAFLNAVAKTDAYDLYNPNMDTAVDSYGCNIKRTGSSGSYNYTVASDYANRPVNYVSWGDSARFANWLSNGQPTTGIQDEFTTEQGVYTLGGAISNAQLMAVSVPSVVTRATWANGTASKWLLTSEDEWYKAAYYKGGGTNAGYWTYPTGSDVAPGRDMTEATNSGNNANYYLNSGSYPIDSGKRTTIVGEFQNSDSPYGTFDQGGNVWEWNEGILLDGAFHGWRGGAFNNDDISLRAATRDGYYPAGEFGLLGFRVSQIPEPASMTLLALGGIGMLFRRRGLRG